MEGTKLGEDNWSADRKLAAEELRQKGIVLKWMEDLKKDGSSKQTSLQQSY